jgi:hypothetical protein
MLEVLENLQRVAVWLSPIVLVLPGVALTVLGLFVWLGGLGFRRVLLGLLGALTGAIAALCLAGKNLVATVSAVLALALIAAVFQRFFAAVLLGVLAGVAAFLVLAWPVLNSRDVTVAGRQDQTDADAKLTVKESLEIVESHWLDLAAKIKHAAAGLPALSWAIVAAVGLGLLVFGLAFRRLGGAMSCAAMGTLMVFAGLVLLLMFKGAAPVTRIESRVVFYGLVAAGMVGFGTLEQFLLCRRTESRHKAESHRHESEKSSKRGWRNR